MSDSAHLVPFSFSYQNHPLRVEQDADGEPLFHAGDLCEIIGHSNPSQAIRQHVDACDFTKREVTCDSDSTKARKTQLANFVREPGLWALILGSHAENAKLVKRWVTAEVLPAIRKTGSYAMPGASTASISVPVARYVDLLESKVAYLERLLATGDQAPHLAPVAPSLEPESATACLDFILNARLYVASERWAGDATTRELIGVARGRASRDIPEREAVQTLARYGMRLDGEYLLVSNTNKDLAGVLRGTRWTVAWRKTLIQFQGAYKSPKPVYIGGYVSRYVAVPLASVEGGA